MLIPAEKLPYFEKMVYLPMVITVLEQDRVTVEKSNFKLNRPYITLIEKAIKAALSDLKETKAYMRQNDLKVLQKNRDDTTTEYSFFFAGYEHNKRYLNVRLRNRTEELLEMYLTMTE